MVMEETIEQLKEITFLLFDYGPYALAALFLLYIAPKHTKRFIDCQLKNKKKQNLLLTVAIGNWAAAFIMCFYIYTNWSPIITYQGELGLHSEDSSFSTIGSNSYIASDAPDNDDDKLSWQFAFITSNNINQKDDDFKFSHTYKDHSTKYYKIPVELLKKGSIEISANHTDPSQLRFENGVTAPYIMKPIATYQPPTHPKGFIAAYAITPAESAKIIKKLSSRNTRFQEVGRWKLRSLTPVELRQLLQTPGLSAQARQHIQAALNNR